MTDYVPRTSGAAFDIYSGGGSSATGDWDPYPQYVLDSELAAELPGLPGSGTVDAESVRDIIGAALRAGGPLTITVNDVADTITLASTATVNSPDAYLLARGHHTGTQTASTISDFNESTQDVVAALLSGGTGVTLAYNDDAGTLTISGVNSGDPESIRDAIGAALVGIGNVSVVVNDAADTITISTTATVNATDAALRDRSTHTGTQPASTISDFTAAVGALAQPKFIEFADQAAIAAAIAGGANLDGSYVVSLAG